MFLYKKQLKDCNYYTDIKISTFLRFCFQIIVKTTLLEKTWTITFQVTFVYYSDENIEIRNLLKYKRVYTGAGTYSAFHFSIRTKEEFQFLAQPRFWKLLAVTSNYTILLANHLI
jgi:hypothetical protein